MHITGEISCFMRQALQKDKCCTSQQEVQLLVVGMQCSQNFPSTTKAVITPITLRSPCWLRCPEEFRTLHSPMLLWTISCLLVQRPPCPHGWSSPPNLRSYQHFWSQWQKDGGQGREAEMTAKGLKWRNDSWESFRWDKKKKDLHQGRKSQRLRKGRPQKKTEGFPSYRRIQEC